MRFKSRIVSLVLVVMLIPASCSKGGQETPQGSGSEDVHSVVPGSSVDATVMRLVRTEGTVDVSDEEGNAIPVVKDMRLFSGNSIMTMEESRAGVSLDEFKGVTLGEKSRAELEQNGKKLSLFLEEGELYFSVSEPLKDDESFEISTATVTLGIRGTSGYVGTDDFGRSIIILTSGHATITAKKDGKSVEIDEGQRVIVSGLNGDKEFTTEDILPESYPDILIEELPEDDDIKDEVDDDILNRVEDEKTIRAAYREYRKIVRSHEKQVAPKADETIVGYRYALVKLREEDDIPVLLLALDYTTDYENSSSIRIYKYTEEKGLLSPSDLIGTGIWNIGGYRAWIGKAPDGQGLFLTERMGMTGNTTITRITFEGDKPVRSEVFSGILETITDEYASEDLDWHDVNDEDGLLREQIPVPEDGGRIVLSGIINEYTYDEVFEVMHQTDPSHGGADTGEKYILFVLDAPKTLTLRHGSGPEAKATDTVKVISVKGAEGIEQYIGEHVIISIDGETCSFPSDARMPLGQPSTTDIHILG